MPRPRKSKSAASLLGRECGRCAVDAALRGADLRYRAVMMTAWSFIIGVLPLVFASGAGAAAMRGIGVCTCCGMLAATLFGILFTPALYVLFERLRGNGMKNRNTVRAKV